MFRKALVTELGREFCEGLVVFQQAVVFRRRQDLIAAMRRGAGNLVACLGERNGVVFCGDGEKRDADLGQRGDIRDSSPGFGCS